MNVEEALARLQHHPEDPDAWETIIISVYKELVLHVGGLLIGFRNVTSESAHDIVHTVLLTFHERWPRLEIEIKSLDELLRYLRTSCRNLLIDRYRHEKHSQEFINSLTIRFSDVFGGETEVYRAIFLKEIIGLLPEQCAKMLTVYINEELTPAEMAEREGASPSGFYSRWYRCLERAKKILLQKKGRLSR